MGPTVDRGEPQTAGDHAFRKLDAAIGATIAGRRLYPNGAAFIPMDIDNVGDVIARRAAEGHDLVLVYPDGSERVLYVRRGRPRMMDVLGAASRLSRRWRMASRRVGGRGPE